MSNRGSGDRGRGGGRGGRGGAPPGGRGGGQAAQGGQGGRGGGPPGRGGGDRGGGFRGRGGPGSAGPGRGGGPITPSAPALNLPPAVLPDRLTNNELDNVIKGLSKIKIQGGGGELPIRPGFGTLGKAIKLRANYFPIQAFPRSLFEYDVQISPGMKVRRVKRRIFELLDRSPEFSPHAPYTANDGASKLIAARALPIPDSGTLDITIDYFDEDEAGPDGSSKKYVITISKVAEHETDTLQRYLNGEPGLHAHDTGPVISAFNIVLLKHAINNGGINVGRNRYFFPQAQELSLDSVLVALRGFYLSVRPTYKQLSMNLNVATTAFYKEGNLAVAIDNYQRETFGGSATAFVKGLRVKTLHLGYKKTVQRVGPLARALKFDHPTYGKISVEEYFKKMYKKTLQRPDGPLVDIGTKVRPNWVPAELCHILPNQPWRGKLTGNQTRVMLDVACRSPAINQADIYRNGLPKMGISPLSPNLTNFGMSLGDQMAVVPGRILNPPKVAYAQGKEVEIRDSAWNLRGLRFHRGAKLGNCLAIAVNEGKRDDFRDAKDPEFTKSVTEFTGMCGTSGMDVRQAKWRYGVLQPPPRGQDQNRTRAMQELRTSIMGLSAGAKPDLILIILSSDDKVFYAALKALLDVTLGVMNVCVISQKFRKNQPQYFANVALKVNMKLGGVNHVLTGAGTAWLKQKKTMLMGADVTHPSPGSLKGTPSIAAVVASVDDTFARYPASMELQESRKEMITNIGPMTVERLKAYETVNGKGKFPDRIIMFRDGVSEGQFITVINEELPKVREACKRVTPNYKPTITYVIAGKRHHTRFYPADEEGTDMKNNGNPKSGTVVDKGVTGVYTFDFFLQSHVGLKGHARPTHYTVVHDENKFTADELQRLCHELSHTFARATRGVSLIPPAYYADLACERGRCYIHGLLNADSGASVAGSLSSDAEAAANFANAQKLWGNGPAKVVDKMYYI